jgi:Uma2 family endonuclease
MATHPQTAIVTLDDFIAAAEATDERLEFVDGQIVAMSGASLEHGLIAQNIALSLGLQLRGRPCRVLSQGTLVALDGSDDSFVPDVAVYCGEPKRRRIRGTDVLGNPTLLVEVLSPSTANYDHGTKWENYRSLSSLRDYLLVWQDQARVEWFTRLGDVTWMFEDLVGLEAEIALQYLGITLKLAEIYDGVLLGAPGGADAGTDEG